MKVKNIKCKDGRERRYIEVHKTQTMSVWKCFNCGRHIYACKKKFALPKKTYLIELKVHVCG
mgnify:CR=1 FL=1